MQVVDQKAAEKKEYAQPQVAELGTIAEITLATISDGGISTAQAFKIPVLA